MSLFLRVGWKLTFQLTGLVNFWGQIFKNWQKYAKLELFLVISADTTSRSKKWFRGVFRMQSNIYNVAFLPKKFTGKSRKNTEKLHPRCLTGF